MLPAKVNKLITNNLLHVLAGFFCCVLLIAVFWALFYTEGFTSVEPSSEEVLKMPFYDRLVQKENIKDPKIKRICVKAAWLAAKDSGEMARKLDKILLHHVQESIDTCEELDDKNTEIAKKAVEEGTKRAIVESDSLITKKLLSENPTPPPSGAKYEDIEDEF